MSMSTAFGDLRKIGIGLTAFGIAFGTLGVVMLFDKGLLAMANVLFLAGVTLIIGPYRSVKFFFQKRKAKGSLFFFVGMALVLLGIPILGVCVELFGFVNLFGDFLPVVIAFLKRTPVIANVLAIPPIKRVTDKLGGDKLPL